MSAQQRPPTSPGEAPRTAPRVPPSGRGDRRGVAGRVAAIEPGFADSPLPAHEYLRGHGAMVLPFSTGHLLALRVWRQSSFGPYVSVWHRTADGAWAIYADGPSLDTTCPRYWGPVLQNTGLADIDVSWPGPNRLRVEMDRPALTWTLSLSAPPLRRALNAVNDRLPRRTAGYPFALRQVVAHRLLDLRGVRFAFSTPSDHEAVIVPTAEFVVEDSRAVLEGRPLGRPVRLDANPTIGGVPLPRRPSFVFGEAHLRAPDVATYRRTRDRVRASADTGAGPGTGSEVEP